MVRTSILGGETLRRGVFGGKRSRLENIILLCALAVAILIYFAIQGIAGLIAAVAFFVLVFLLTYPLPFGYSAAALIVRKVRGSSRLRNGLATFTPAWTIAPGTKRTGPPRDIPDGVGKVRMYSYSPPTGGSIAVVHHENPGTEPYLTAVMEIEGAPSGLREEEDYSSEAARFGRILSSCSGPSSLVSTLQLVTRVVPVDSAVHEWFILRNRSLTVPPQLFDSYAELIGNARSAIEQHRSFLIAKFPLSAEFAEVAHAIGGPTFTEDTRAQVVIEEMNRLATMAANADLRPVRMLGPRRLAALMRSLQDPDFFIDDTEGVDWQTCWQRTVNQPKYVLTNDKWATRIARVNGDAVTTEPVNMRWLAPLIVGVQPATIRTISVTVEMSSPRKARTEARRHLAEDRGRYQQALREGVVTDLSDEAQVAASQQRLFDLRAGSGHAGARWGMYLAVTSTPDQVRRTSDIILEKAGESGIANLNWQDGAHDITQHFTWPLCRGLTRK